VPLRSPWTTKARRRRELIAGARGWDLARPLEHRGLGVDARSPKPTIVSAPGDHPHRDRIAPGGRIDGIDPERCERRVHRALEHRHQVRLPLISTRGRVQIGSGLDCTCSMTQRANCWSTQVKRPEGGGSQPARCRAGGYCGGPAAF
jgi:hypothetical protein